MKNKLALNYPILHELKITGRFELIDLYFANAIANKSNDNSPELLVAAALTSRERADGFVSFDFSNFQVKYGELFEQYGIAMPDHKTWQRQVSANPLVGGPGEELPLILDSGRLYLGRYWHYEAELFQRLLRLATNPPALPDSFELGLELSRLFPEKSKELNYQEVAVLAATLNRFAVISGGPGTGKTTTLVKILILKLLIDPSLTISLTAPTGKAAGRMNEALLSAFECTAMPENVKTKLQQLKASTLHRLLGYQHHKVTFRYHSGNPLPHDLIVVDEASMIDLALMSKLVQAIKSGGQLILLGDMDQLSAVEAGACFGDLTRFNPNNSFSDTFATLLVKNGDLDQRRISEIYENLKTPFQNSIVKLTKSWRFSESSGIGRLSRKVNQGEDQSALDVFESFEDIHFIAHNSSDLLRKQLESYIVPRFRSAINSQTPEEALVSLGQFRVLCALRETGFGVESVNRQIETILLKHRLISEIKPIYEHLPIMITQNDYGLRLFNGDIGILRRDETGRLRAFFFSTEDRNLISVLPSMLPSFEKVFAMTVHKSQGSEFDDVFMVLPDVMAPVLTRELVYTGITRARKQVWIYSLPAIFRQAVKTRTELGPGLTRFLDS